MKRKPPCLGPAYGGQGWVLGSWNVEPNHSSHGPKVLRLVWPGVGHTVTVAVASPPVTNLPITRGASLPKRAGMPVTDGGGGSWVREDSARISGKRYLGRAGEERS